ncbi:MAG: 23S rRNA (pseudouridine(1915)-N(3))-methyltransferase RlmH [Bacteroidales bacterium]|nr:23S rRNA (pseudouridine(1915)-N(3))-methyltransferase RlmH [Bacteroidales bacterium]
MNILLYTIGVHKDKNYYAIEKDLINKIQHFNKFSLIEIEEPAKINKLPIHDQIKKYEELISKKISESDYNIVLDSKGKEYTSEKFAQQLSAWLLTRKKNLVFIIGGPHGFSDSFKKKFPCLSLSQMTFNHLLVRIIFLEQLYRAFCIIKNIPYHY